MTLLGRRAVLWLYMTNMEPAFYSIALLISYMLYLFYQWNVSSSDLSHKLHVGTVEHDMKMLHGMHRLEGFPILEPDDLENQSMLALSSP